MDLALATYEVTRGGRFPAEERYGLPVQMRRASISVASNIAEGQARRTTKEFVRFLHMARGSLAELDTQSMISKDLGYLTEAQHRSIEQQIDELQRILFALVAKLQARVKE